MFKNYTVIIFQESDLDASIVDTLAVREVCEKCHVTETEVHNALLAGDPQDQVRLFIHPFSHSFIHSSIHSFFRPSIHLHSIHLPIHSFIHSFFYSFILLFIHSFIHSSIHSLLHPFMHITLYGLISYHHTIIWEKTHAGSLGRTCRQSRTLFRLLTTPRFFNRLWRNRARTICRGQRGSLWCRNFEIQNGCHGKMEMQTLRSHLARKGRHLIAKHPK